jgi:uncharacterized membrane protein YsdA (DUF1294 family)
MPRHPRPRPRPPRRSAADLVALAAFALAYAAATLLHGLPAWVHVLYAATGLASVALYGADKAAAVAGRDRIPESTLLAMGLAGGWPGAIVAQRLFRHKTSKRSFRVKFWLSVAAHVALVAGLAALLAR